MLAATQVIQNLHLVFWLILLERKQERKQFHTA
nr:MAG TPA: Matrix protein 2 design, M2, VIRAL PROTEIN [Caudoviricetes sp.]